MFLLPLCVLYRNCTVMTADVKSVCSNEYFIMNRSEIGDKLHNQACHAN
jgi:hypothetical protein